jgi:hypothetical protein
MPIFPKDICYLQTEIGAACIEFRLDEHRRRAFNASQLITYSLDPNPDADDDKNAPPQKLSFAFSTADVTVLGWRLGSLADCLRENRLAAIGIVPQRYSGLEHNSPCVSAIAITDVSK